jgi:hypothetical protein
MSQQSSRQASSDTASQSDGPSTASIPNLQEFLNNYVCQANANGTNYFYFEAFDETWKVSQRWTIWSMKCRLTYYHRTKNMVVLKATGVFSTLSEFVR